MISLFAIAALFSKEDHNLPVASSLINTSSSAGSGKGSSAISYFDPISFITAARYVEGRLVMMYCRYCPLRSIRFWRGMGVVSKGQDQESAPSSSPHNGG